MSLCGNEISLSVNDCSLTNRDISLAENDISLLGNEISPNQNDISLVTERNIATTRTIDVPKYRRYFVSN